MPNKKISQLTDGNPAQSADQIPINRAGANFRITANSIATLAAQQFSNNAQVFFPGGGLPITYDLTGFNTYADANSYVVLVNYISDSFDAANAGILYVEYVDGSNFKIHSTNPLDDNGVRFITYPASV